MSGPLIGLELDAKEVVKICPKIMIGKRFLLAKNCSNPDIFINATLQEQKDREILLNIF